MEGLAKEGKQSTLQPLLARGKLIMNCLSITILLAVLVSVIFLTNNDPINCVIVSWPPE